MPKGFEWRTQEEKHDLWVHSHLKQVEMGGFRGVPNQISFAIYLLRSAIALEQMVLDKGIWKYARCGVWKYVGCGGWADRLMSPLNGSAPYFWCGRLEREARFRNVKIIFK